MVILWSSFPESVWANKSTMVHTSDNWIIEDGKATSLWVTYARQDSAQINKRRLHVQEFFAEFA
jgi:hypothetical protein